MGMWGQSGFIGWAVEMSRDLEPSRATKDQAVGLSLHGLITQPQCHMFAA